MSRIGKLPIEIPQGVKVSVTDDMITVEGPKGKLEQDYKPEVEIKVEEKEVTVSVKKDTKTAHSYHGLYRSLISNMVVGVSQGYSKSLVINGVGYRAEVNKDILTLNLGYSQPIDYYIEDGITVTAEGNKVTVAGVDKQRVGQVSAEIRSLRPPEPYKGKGIRYDDENIRRKIGKSGIK
ncbi:MAG: 50S ribosomal protein L6 [Spirochaetales bacterium]|uniref:Large ribosomal subunit protein uL6 n=1 Tax=Candidatus Thalassospirochaeta sargassi TaxID=3119039 RepID=A0AAJ1IJ25_9SPIO|nr:50S ribosomal protein L6 [Spirochaetales bacterium]